ncbi:MAG: GTP-binding protein [Sarcina sp.]
MKKVVGVFAHVDAGKTTFSESLLYNTKVIRHKGRVDHKDTFLDSHEIEKERGITVFSDIAFFDYKDDKYFFIDTPGHIDFSPEMERSISILDYAILMVSAVEMIQSHTITIWELLKKYNIPTFIFINKIDRANASLENTLNSLESELTKDIIYMESNILDDYGIEFMAQRDEELLELYLNDDFNFKIWNEKLKKLIKNREVFPVFKGSALLDEGIKEFFDSFHNLTYTKEAKGDFKGRVFKVKYDEKGNRITFIKALKGQIKTKDDIKIEKENEIISEKINEIRFYNGNKYQLKDSVSSGDIFAVLGINSLKAGDAIGFEEELSIVTKPTLNVKINYDKKLNSNDVFKIFKILESEDNTLNVIWNEEIKELSISIMGKIQLEVLEKILNDRFNLKVTFEKPQILYKETIKGKGIGCGHFEPLGHYSEVHLLIEEGVRGSGLVFENKCHTNDLTIGNQNLIRTHIFEREHKGILTRSPIDDLKITLLTGRAHNKHTSGGDFREATKRALRQGLEVCDSVLLEPYYKFTIIINLDDIGRVLADIQKMKGEFIEPQTLDNNRIRIKGRAPVKTFMDYPLEFISFTKGRGYLSMIFDGYDFCHNEKEVIEEINYDKNADIEYTSTSIFCSKGQAYLVDGNKAKEYMHCEVKS